MSTRTTRRVTRSARPSPTSRWPTTASGRSSPAIASSAPPTSSARPARRSCSAAPVTVSIASCRRSARTACAPAGIHGGRSQNQRDRALKSFTDGQVAALVATDVAARGIHVDDVACVVHFDLPADAKDYQHRSGRTARAGASGIVVSLVARHQVRDARKLQRAAGIEGEVEQPPAPSGVRRAPVRPEPEQHARPSRSGPPRGGQSRNGQSRNGQSRNGQSRGGQPQRGRRRDGGRSGTR